MTVTAAKVVDSSALGAVLFAEGPATAWRSAADGAAPCTSAAQLRTRERLSEENSREPEQARLSRRVASWSNRGIELVDVEHYDVLSVAEQFGLRSYDATICGWSSD